MIKIILKGKPLSTQTIYGQRGRIRYLKKEAKERKEYYKLSILAQYKGPIIEDKVRITTKLYFTNKLRRDRDNFHKLSIDALEGIVIKDDSQIREAKVEKHIDKENPRIEIYLELL